MNRHEYARVTLYVDLSSDLHIMLCDPLEIGEDILSETWDKLSDVRYVEFELMEEIADE